MSKPNRPHGHYGGSNLPPGWKKTAQGLWTYESGATVEDTGSQGDSRYKVEFAPDEWARFGTRKEAMEYVMGTDE